MLKLLFLSFSVFFLVGCGNVSKTDVKIEYVPDSLTIMSINEIEQLDAVSVQQFESLRDTLIDPSFLGDQDIYNFYIVFEITSDKELADYFKRNISPSLIDTSYGSMVVKKSNNTYYVFSSSHNLYYKSFFSDDSYSLDLSVKFSYNDSDDVGLFEDSVDNSSNEITIPKEDLSNLLDSFGIPYNLSQQL